VTPAQKIEKLQALLVRVRENARRPRLLVPDLAARSENTSPVEASSEEEPTVVTRLADSALERVAAEAPADYDEQAFDEEEEEEEYAEDEEDELLDEDIVDLTDMAVEGSTPPEAEAAAETEDEEPPSSSPRPKMPARSMDEALTGAAAEGRQPLKTAPAESGSQVASTVVAEPLVPPEGAKLLATPGAAASTERISATTEVEPSRGPDLKPAILDKAAVTAEAVSTPRAVSPSFPPVLSAPSPAARAALTPEVVSRPMPTGVLSAEFVGEAHRFKPQSFVELLDASLAL
jgi:hypothetical protein